MGITTEKLARAGGADLRDTNQVSKVAAEYRIASCAEASRRVREGAPLRVRFEELTDEYKQVFAPRARQAEARKSALIAERGRLPAVKLEAEKPLERRRARLDADRDRVRLAREILATELQQKGSVELRVELGPIDLAKSPESIEQVRTELQSTLLRVSDVARRVDELFACKYRIQEALTAVDEAQVRLEAAQRSRDEAHAAADARAKAIEAEIAECDLLIREAENMREQRQALLAQIQAL